LDETDYNQERIANNLHVALLTCNEAEKIYILEIRSLIRLIRDLLNSITVDLNYTTILQRCVHVVRSCSQRQNWG